MPLATGQLFKTGTKYSTKHRYCKTRFNISASSNDDFITYLLQNISVKNAAALFFDSQRWVSVFKQIQPVLNRKLYLKSFDGRRQFGQLLDLQPCDIVGLHAGMLTLAAYFIKLRKKTFHFEVQLYILALDCTHVCRVRSRLLLLTSEHLFTLTTQVTHLTPNIYITDSFPRQPQ